MPLLPWRQILTPLNLTAILTTTGHFVAVCRLVDLGLIMPVFRFDNKKENEHGNR